MRKTKFLAPLLLACGLFSNNASANSGSELSSDVITGVVPIGAFAYAYFTDDEEGQKQWLRNTLANQLIITSARVAFNPSLGKRPNGGKYGFPSGHVGFVTSGASFLQERYGWKLGVPAYMLSAYVAAQRVRDDHHHWRDVIASGVLSFGIAKLFVTPQGATYVAPAIGPDFIGMRWERSF
ncbi:phosphatase PAP2 family protein [Stenotrophobium rhamnosiphilum]|uniref:Phosphatase n=1 Tax=Stenotrophobium rhamnosiphilum TaxID=2029166 RepID=A0A2T5MCK0_9GAMM|nr:phosphatase PAP2 family protein [Stenotrophobium rhamnosiphilum]PTU30293.1 phosphatase [Stenotrophobium rhamnosiphilum]